MSTKESAMVCVLAPFITSVLRILKSNRCWSWELGRGTVLFLSLYLRCGFIFLIPDMLLQRLFFKNLLIDPTFVQ